MTDLIDISSDWVSRFGEEHKPFIVSFKINKKYYKKRFKTMEEVLIFRDRRSKLEALFKVSDALVNGRKIPQNVP
jgi:hypothetical protein